MYFKRAALAAVLLQAFSVNAETFTRDEAAVMVTATRVPSRTSEVLSDVTVIHRDEIERAGQTSLFELLGAQPGIQITQNGGRGATGSLSIRGANSNHTLVLIDGQRVSSATAGTTAVEQIPLEQVERIEILRGPASSLYGADAVAGVIQIFTRRGDGQPAPVLHLGVGRYNTSIAAASYGGAIGDTRFHVQAGVEDSKGFSSIKAPKGGFFDMYNGDADGYVNRNFSARVSHRVDKDLELSASALQIDAQKHFDSTNCDAFTILCTAGFDNRLKQVLDAFGAEVRYRIQPAWKTAFRLGRSDDKNVNWQFDPLANTVAEQRYHTRQDEFAWQNDIDATIGRVMAAVEWRREEVMSTQSFVVPDRTTKSLVLGYQGSFGAHSVQASGRNDAIARMGSHRSGSLAYGYHFASAWTARAAVGTSYHVPTFNDLYWPVDQANFYQGNPALKPERGRNQELGLAYETGATRASATLYRNRISDLLNYTPGSAPTFIGFMSNLSKVTLKGASFQYERRSGPWNWKATYDVLAARDDANGRVLQRRAPRTGTLELRRQWGAFDLGAQAAATSARFNDTANTQTLSGYTIVNLDIDYALRKDLLLTAKVTNLFDRDYVQVRSTLNPFNDYAVAGRSLFVGLRYSPGK